MNTNEMATSPISTFYSTNINGVMWEVPERYQDLKPINSGEHHSAYLSLYTVYNAIIMLKCTMLVINFYYLFVYNRWIWYGLFCH